MADFIFDLQRFGAITGDDGTTPPANAIFSVTKSGTTTYYDANSDFTTDNLSGATEIKLLGNITLSASVEISQTVEVEGTTTLDLNGFKLERTSTETGNDDGEGETEENYASISHKNVIFVKTGGNLTITDTSSNKNGSITSNDETISNQGTLIISSGTIAGLCAVTNAGTLNISGGTIKTADDLSIKAYSNYEADEETGKITSYKGEGCGVYNETGSLTISGGDISGTLFGVYNASLNSSDGNENNPIVTVDGGTISGGYLDDPEKGFTGDEGFEGAGIYIGQGTFTVSENSTATIKGTPAAIAVSDQLSPSGSDSTSPIQILGGTLDGHLAIDKKDIGFSTVNQYLVNAEDVSVLTSFYNFTNAKFTEADYFPMGYGYIKNTDGTVTFNETIATVDDKECKTWAEFAEALETAGKSEDDSVEIKMSASIKLVGPTALQITGGNVKLDLNGQTISASSIVSSDAVIDVQAENVTISGGTIKGTDVPGISVGNFTCTVDNCAIDVTNITANSGGIYSSGTLTIKNSTISVKGDSSEDTADDNKTTAVRNTSGTITIESTTIEASGKNVLGIANTGENASIDITAGNTVSVSGDGSKAVTNDNKASLTVSGGTVTAEGEGSKAVTNETGGDVTINGGEISGGIEHTPWGSDDEDAGSVEITGGTISGEITVKTDEGDETTKSGIKITGGNFDTNVSQYLDTNSNLGIKVGDNTYYSTGWNKDSSDDDTTKWVYVVKETDATNENPATGKIAATVTGTTTKPTITVGEADSSDNNKIPFNNIPYDYTVGEIPKFIINDETNYKKGILDYDGASTKVDDKHCVSVTTGTDENAITKYYTTLAKAVEAAKEGSTVTVIKATDLSETVTVDKELTLNTSKAVTYTGTGSPAIKVVNNGKLTKTGTGKFVANNESANVFEVESGGKLEVKAGSITGGTNGVGIKSSGTLTIASSGTISGGTAGVQVDDGTFNMTKGTVKNSGTTGSALIIDDKGVTATIKGGTVGADTNATALEIKNTDENVSEETTASTITLDGVSTDTTVLGNDKPTYTKGATYTATNIISNNNTGITPEIKAGTFKGTTVPETVKSNSADVNGTTTYYTATKTRKTSPLTELSLISALKIIANTSRRFPPP